MQRLYPGQIPDEAEFSLPAQPVQANAMRIVLSRQYRFGSMMLWLVYFMGLFLVYLLGSWLPTLVKEVGLTVGQAAVMTAMYQAGGTLGSLFAGWLMDRINPHRALGLIYAVGGLFTMAMGYAAASFALICLLAFISGACLNGANTGHERALRPLLSYRSTGYRLQLDARRWPHGRDPERLCRGGDAGAEYQLRKRFPDPWHSRRDNRRRAGGQRYFRGWPVGKGHRVNRARQKYILNVDAKAGVFQKHACPKKKN